MRLENYRLLVCVLSRFIYIFLSIGVFQKPSYHLSILVFTVMLLKARMFFPVPELRSSYASYPRVTGLLVSLKHSKVI